MMPAINDQGEEVSVLEDFMVIDKWVATETDDFRPITGIRIVNTNGLNLSGVHNYLPDTYNDFKVKNVYRDKKVKTVCQTVEGPWKDGKMQLAMEQLNLRLDDHNPDNPHLVDNNVCVRDEDGTELVFSGNWLIKGWIVDLVINHNANGIKEAEFFRDKIRWVKIGDKTTLAADEQQSEAFTSTYWMPY